MILQASIRRGIVNGAWNLGHLKVKQKNFWMHSSRQHIFQNTLMSHVLMVEVVVAKAKVSVAVSESVLPMSMYTEKDD